MTRQRTSGERRRLILLGSTGSIGVNVLEVVEHLESSGLARFEVVGLAAGSNASLLREQAERFSARHVALAEERQAGVLAELGSVFTGPSAALQLVETVAEPGDLAVGAMVGAAGIPATLAAIERGCDVALANKETLVAAGGLVMSRVREHGVDLLPIDSEHSAVAQCLRSGRAIDEIRRVVLTASGGPFRRWPKERIDQATVEEALRHPTWNMGRKITVDSASMMNKALEVIEAHWLFGLPPEKVDVIIHPQSVVHSFVEFVDGSVVAQLGPPDMRTPIQYALTWPRRLGGRSRKMDWSELGSLEFEGIDHERFPAVKLAYQVITAGGTAGATLNAANEMAVQAFLDRRIRFGLIAGLVEETLAARKVEPVRSLDDVVRADRSARADVAVRIEACGSGSGRPAAAGFQVGR